MELTGRGGRLLLGGRTAATLGAWETEQAGPLLSIHARLAQGNAFWLQLDSRYTLILDIGPQGRTWRAVTLVAADDTHVWLEHRAPPKEDHD